MTFEELMELLTKHEIKFQRVDDLTDTCDQLYKLWVFIDFRKCESRDMHRCVRLLKPLVDDITIEANNGYDKIYGQYEHLDTVDLVIYNEEYY